MYGCRLELLQTEMEGRRQFDLERYDIVVDVGYNCQDNYNILTINFITITSASAAVCQHDMLLSKSLLYTFAKQSIRAHTRLAKQSELLRQCQEELCRLRAESLSARKLVPELERLRG